MTTNFQNQMCQIHYKVKDYFKIIDQREVSCFCSECVKKLNSEQRPIIQIHHLSEFKKQLITYVKRIQIEYENLKKLFQEIAVETQILKVKEMLDQINQENLKYNFVAQKCEQGQITSFEAIYKNLADQGIKDEDIKQCNFQFTGFENNFKIISEALVVLKRANEELTKILPKPKFKSFPGFLAQNNQNPMPNFVSANFPLQNNLKPFITQVQKLELNEQNFIKQIGQDFAYDSLKINSLSLNETEKFLAIGADQFKIDGKLCFIQIWELNPTYLRVFQNLEGHQRSVKIVKFISETVLLSGGVDQTIIIWKQKQNTFNQQGLQQWEKQQQLSGHSLCVNCLDFNILTNKIVSGSQEIIIWKEDYSQSKIYVKGGSKQMDEVIQFLTFTNNYQYLFVGNQSLIYLLEIINDNLEVQKKIKPDSNQQFQFLMSLDSFDFISFYKKEICIFQQELDHYNRKSINQQEEIKHVSFNYFKNMKLMTVCYSNNQCQISQILMDDNNSYQQKKIFECEGLLCQFGLKEPKFCVINKKFITMYTFRNI